MIMSDDVNWALGIERIHGCQAVCARWLKRVVRHPRHPERSAKRDPISAEVVERFHPTATSPGYGQTKV